MSAIGFKCDAGEILFEDCLAECPIGARCLSRPTLVEMAKQREWKGKPSTTQLLKGTREAYLEIACTYFISPKDQAFRLLGTKHHSTLEKTAGDFELVEVFFEDEDMTGIADYYDAETQTLIDYKTLGSFKTAQLLGIEFELIDSPDGEVYKIGEKKGQLKQVKKFTRNPFKADYGEYCLQLNRYRLFYEKSGFPVKSMQIQITVRDGGTAIAEGRGVDELMYLIDVPRLNDEEVNTYFANKASALHQAIKDGGCHKCTNDETWEGRKCSGYCNVRKYCDEMGD